MSTAGHPQTDGQTEVIIRSLKEMLRHYVNAFHNDWHRYLPLLEFAYNDSISSSTGYTPFFLNTGRNPMSLMDLSLSACNLPIEVRKKLDKSTVNIFANIKKSLMFAKKNLHRTRSNMITQLGLKRTKAVTFSPGDMVSISIRHFTATGAQIPGKPPTVKLAPRYFGPVPVLHSVSDNAYKLDVSEDPLLMHIHPVINVDKLRLIFTSDEYHSHTATPPTVTIDGQTEYVIDRIINDRYNGRRKRYEYLTLWQGLPLSKSKWLSIKSFTGSAIKFVHRYLLQYGPDEVDVQDGVPDDQSREVREAMQRLARNSSREATATAICSDCNIAAITTTVPSRSRHSLDTSIRYKHYCAVCFSYFSTWPYLTRSL
jgi:hypothetical protein